MDRRAALAGALAAGLGFSHRAATASASPKGRFSGQLRIELQDDGREVTLLEPFAYVDAAGVAWAVKAGAHLDGASIPRAFWSVVGGPFEGRYRKASVVHDWYCDVRERPWQRVHRMFYAAMLDSGVDELQAKMLFLAVWAGGPRWNQQAIDNVRLAIQSGFSAQQVCASAAGDPARCPEFPLAEPQNYPPLLTDSTRFRALAADIRSRNPPLADIEALFPPQKIDEPPPTYYTYKPRDEPDPNPPV
jgi:hypothetical protein